MSTPVTKATTRKPVKISPDVWQSVSHESVDRGATIGSLLGVAWAQFMQIPLPRRERLIREYTEAKRAA